MTLLISSLLCPLGHLLAQSSSPFLLIHLTLLSSSYFSAYFGASHFHFPFFTISVETRGPPYVPGTCICCVCTTWFCWQHRKQVELHHRTDEEADAVPVMKHLHSWEVGRCTCKPVPLWLSQPMLFPWHPCPELWQITGAFWEAPEVHVVVLTARCPFHQPLGGSGMWRSCSIFRSSPSFLVHKQSIHQGMQHLGLSGC